MLKILIVDDEEAAIQALRRCLHPMRDQWKVTFAASAREALKLLGQLSFDVIVADIQMPFMDGTALLKQVRDQHPAMVRIGASAYPESANALEAAEVAHQFLAKPCGLDLLKRTISEACRLRGSLPGEELPNLVAGLAKLPSPSFLYRRIIQEIEKPESDIRAIGKIIESDMAMTAKILQLVNSAFFGLPRRVRNATDASILLGVDTIKALVLMTQVFSEADANSKGIPVAEIWQHSQQCAGFAKQIALHEGWDKETVDEAFLSALLHDVGKLILADNFPEVYDRLLVMAAQKGVPVWRLEEECWSASHANVGAYLLGLWGLPQALVQTVGCHHLPAAHPGPYETLAAVHVADALENERQASALSGPVQVNWGFMEAVGLDSRYAGWREVCLGGRPMGMPPERTDHGAHPFRR